MNKNTKKGLVRGLLYPAIAWLAHAGLTMVLSKGWLTASGTVAIMAFVGYVDHIVLPKTNMVK